MIEKECLYCKKTFYVRNYRKDTAKFCSRNCASAYHYNERLLNIDQAYKKGNQYRKGKKPTNAFPKGHVPWNKGIKGLHHSPATEFKKGQISRNKMPVGTITQRNEKGVIRNFIKVAEPNVWKYYFVYLWEQANGKVPKGCVIHHINKVPTDDRLENLVCLTRAEHINIHRKQLKSGGEDE